MRTSTALATLCILALMGCDDASTHPAKDLQGAIRVLLTDRPAEFDEVNIVVTEVSSHAAEADSASGWIVLDDRTRTFDLLTLANGQSAVLCHSPLDPGHYTQIRLKLADSCTVVVDGVTLPLEVPSGSQSGLKLNHPFEIEPDILYELTLDFDATRSIHVAGNGRYILRPVIRLIAA